MPDENFSDNPTIPVEPNRVAPELEAIDAAFPQLDVLELLGQGGMGAVYKARQRELDRIVALKVLAPEIAQHEHFADRFSREARALARLQHPNIVTVHDSGRSGDVYYLLMEYVDGANLRGLLANGALAPEQALALVPPLCDALQYAHDEGVMHRDIKPENILVDRRGRVKIADFGLAKLMTDRRTDLTLTAPNQVMGTMNYMAPEQFERPNAVDHRADIYALGVVVYEMLTGELPLGRFPLPSQRAPIDVRFDEVVLRALEKEPDRRYQQASELGTALAVTATNGAAAPAHAFGAPPTATHVVAASTPGAPTRPTMHTPAPSPPGPPQPGTHVTPAPTGAMLVGPGRSEGIGYLLWCLCLFGVCGVHRLYAGKYITGILWFFTFGCFYVGQFIDLFLIPSQIRRANERGAVQTTYTMHPVPPSA